MNTEIVTETQVSYEKPTVITYTEAELMASMEAWGVSSGFPY